MSSSYSPIEQAIAELKEEEKRIVSGEDKTIEVIADFKNYLKNEAVDAGVAEEMKSVMKEYIDLQKEIEVYLSALSDVKIEVMTLDDDQKDYFQIMQQKLHEIKERVQDERPETHLKYKRLLEEINRNPNDGPITSQVVEDAEGNFQILGTELNTVDPISKVQIQHALRNRKCSHNYDKQTILNHIKLMSRRGPVRCPVSGCAGYVREIDLEEDEELQRYLERNK